MIDARRHGADIVTYHEVTGFLRTGDRIEGIIMRNVRTGEKRPPPARSQSMPPASGDILWQKAGIEINMFPAKGSLLIFGHRVNNKVINRCRKPANADILVPGDTICLIGTTSDRIPFDQIDNMDVTPEEVDVAAPPRGIAKLSPPSPTHASLRAYAGVRPLKVAADNDPTGRSISRSISMPRPCQTRRRGGIHHHHRRQTDDIPPDGGGGYRHGLPQTLGAGRKEMRDSASLPLPAANKAHRR